MDILHRTGVAIDDFRKPYRPLCFLTHAHSDSRRGQVPDGVVCHREVASDLHAIQPGVRTESCRHFVKMTVSTVSFVPFPTQHCCGSTGFWFPDQAVLYVGDGRVDDKLLTTVDMVLRTWPPTASGHEVHVVGDGLFHRHPRKGSFPSLDEVALFVRGLAAQGCRPFRFTCVNSSHFFFLHKFVHEREPVHWGDGWTKPELNAVMKIMKKGNAKKKHRNMVLATPATTSRGVSAEEFVPLPMKVGDVLQHITDDDTTVLATAMWFVVHDRDPGLVYWNAPSRTLRICLSFHADRWETEHLMDGVRRTLVPDMSVQFWECHTRPLPNLKNTMKEND